MSFLVGAAQSLTHVAKIAAILSIVKRKMQRLINTAKTSIFLPFFRWNMYDRKIPMCT